MVGVDDGAPMAQGKPWRWGLYAISLAFAFSELITGLVAQPKDEWVLPWVLSYAIWSLVFVIFTWSCHRALPQRFLVSSFGYLVCTAATMALFRMLGATSEKTFYIWIPLATNGGIFVGLGAKDSLKCLGTIIHSLLLRLVAGFHAIIRGEDHHELPLHIYSTSPTDIPHRQSSLPNSNPPHHEIQHTNYRHGAFQRPGDVPQQLQ
ncbi:hypothetical protein LA080_008862 [Diaporthe eres]|nr:hypothetical protein LA080_008862 [Diaporthe eres]